MNEGQGVFMPMISSLSREDFRVMVGGVERKDFRLFVELDGPEEGQTLIYFGQMTRQEQQSVQVQPLARNHKLTTSTTSG